MKKQLLFTGIVGALLWIFFVAGQATLLAAPLDIGAPAADNGNAVNAPGALFDASGRVTLNSVGLSGVTMTINSNPVRTTTTDANGNYIFEDLMPGSYTITPSRSGYIFVPSSLSFTIVSASVSNLNFSATPVQNTYSASGRVTSNGVGLAGVTITINTNPAQTRTTDSNGSYTFANLPTGTYTVTPSRFGYSFTPPGRTFTISTANITNLDFTAALILYDASGRVTLDGVGLAGVTMTVNTNPTRTTTTDSNGNYIFADLPQGNYTVTPSRSGYSFTPVNRPFTIANGDVTGLDFSATAGAYDAGGRVTLNGVGLAGVTITLSANPVRTTLTDSNGNYLFADLPRDNYTVTPSRSGYDFFPTARDFVIVSSDVTGLDFAATARVYSASGQVTDNAMPVAGVTVVLTSGDVEVGYATTDANGAYRFEFLSAGEYRVVPQHTDYLFVPGSRAFTITAKNVSGLNFEANPALLHLYLPMAQRNHWWQEPLPTPTPTATATPEACRTEIEPNNIASADANGNFEPNRCILGAIPNGDANDFYRIQFPGGTFDSSLTQIPAGTNYQLALYNLVNGQANPIGASSNPGNQDEHLVISNLTPGVYYIGVQSLTGNSPQQYRLIWTYTPWISCRNEIEPNGAFPQADANGDFEAERCINGSIPNGDADDFYRIQHPGGIFNADLTNIPANTDYELTLYRISNGQLVGVGYSVNSGNADENINLSAAAGIYYLRVHTYLGNSPQPYRLIWTHTP